MNATFLSTSHESHGLSRTIHGSNQVIHVLEPVSRDSSRLEVGLSNITGLIQQSTACTQPPIRAPGLLALWIRNVDFSEFFPKSEYKYKYGSLYEWPLKSEPKSKLDSAETHSCESWLRAGSELGSDSWIQHFINTKSWEYILVGLHWLTFINEPYYVHESNVNRSR